MARSNDKKSVSGLPLRHTDLAGRIGLLTDAGLVKGDVETGLNLMGSRTLLETAENMHQPVENVIGAIPYQLGLATNFRVNGREVLVPLAVREPTVIAACSKAAKLVLPEGFSVNVSEYNEMTAEILFSGYNSLKDAEEADELIRSGMRYAISRTESSKATRGQIIGTDVLFISPEKETDRPMIVVKVRVNVGDFMGAKIATATAKRLAKFLDGPAGRAATTVICSNRRAGRMVAVRAIIPWAHIDHKTARTMMELQRWAKKDLDRADTHVKGIMNAVMGVCRASGQDEEAVFIAVAGMLRKTQGVMTEYQETRDGLECRLSMKIPVATCGGGTQDPFSKMVRGIAGVEDTRDLLQVIGAAGLAANIAALHCHAREQEEGGILAAFEKVRPA